MSEALIPVVCRGGPLDGQTVEAYYCDDQGYIGLVDPTPHFYPDESPFSEFSGGHFCLLYQWIPDEGVAEYKGIDQGPPNREKREK